MLYPCVEDNQWMKLNLMLEFVLHPIWTYL